MAGVIDPDYRGDIKIVVHNFGANTILIKPNMKIAQFTVEKVDNPTIEVCTTLSTTQRQDKGFGSSDDDQQIIYPTVKQIDANHHMSVIQAYFQPTTRLSEKYFVSNWTRLDTRFFKIWTSVGNVQKITPTKYFTINIK